MFGSIKKKLGIEGVKIELIVPPTVKAQHNNLQGSVKIVALSDNHIIRKINITLIEKYTRGRGSDRLINEYTLGEISLSENLSISKNDILEIPFSLPFFTANSEMDKLGQKNILTKGIVSALKKISGVYSTYSVVAEAIVEGTKLNPLDKKPILLQ
jgi:hypothetical protein